MVKKIHVLMTLSNPFTHDPRVYNEAKSLVKAGYDVTVLAWDRKKVNPLNEVKEGINVVRVRNTKFMEFLHYDIFRLHFWWKKGYKKALELYKKNPFDIVHCHDLDTLPIGVKLKKKLNLPLIYDAHEVWAYMVAKDLFWWRYYIKKEKKLLNYTNRIITVGEEYKKYLQSLTDRPIDIILNAKPLVMRKYKPPENDVFTLLYIGTLSKPRFIIEIMEVIKDIPGVKLIVGGIGKDEYIQKVKERAVEADNISFLGKVPLEQVIPMTWEADAIVCMFDPTDRLSKIGLPNKLFEAMVAGRPIIVSKGTYLGKIVEKEKCGLVVEYSKKAFRGAVINLRDNSNLREELGRNALNAAIRKYNWESQEKKLLYIYETLRKG